VSHATTEAAEVLAVLAGLGYGVEADWRPNRVEVHAPGRGRVDVHPMVRDAAGNGVQFGTAGERWALPAAAFTTGVVAGRPVRCLTADQQIEWHRGYEHRDVDRADLALLHRLREEGR
jgi:lincosamide nucleotidyltransferase A/C/D/E